MKLKYFSVPETKVRWSISNGGQLEVIWLERMAYFANKNRVRLNWRLENTMEAGQVEGEVGGVTLEDNLQLGGHYHVTLTDLETNLTESFNFTACK